MLRWVCADRGSQEANQHRSPRVAGADPRNSRSDNIVATESAWFSVPERAHRSLSECRAARLLCRSHQELVRVVLRWVPPPPRAVELERPVASPRRCRRTSGCSVRLRDLVAGAVHDEHGQREQRELLLQAFVVDRLAHPHKQTASGEAGRLRASAALRDTSATGSAPCPCPNRPTCLAIRRLVVERGYLESSRRRFVHWCCR